MKSKLNLIVNVYNILGDDLGGFQMPRQLPPGLPFKDEV